MPYLILPAKIKCFPLPKREVRYRRSSDLRDQTYSLALPNFLVSAFKSRFRTLLPLRGSSGITPDSLLMSFLIRYLSMSFSTLPSYVKVLLCFAFFQMQAFAHLPSCYEQNFESVPLKYAKQFQLHQNTDTLKISFQKLSDVIFLSRSQIPNCKEAHTRTALSSFALFSTTYLYPFEVLNGADFVKGFANKQLISSVFWNQHDLVELGETLRPEWLVSQKISSLMLSPFFYDEQILQKSRRLGLAIFPNLDYLETTPLARLEWIKFFGAILAKEKESQDFFQTVETGYIALKNKLMDTTPLLIGHHYHGQWFAPGRDHELTQLIRHIGGQTAFMDLNGRGPYILNLEEIFLRAKATKLWLPMASWTSLAEGLMLDGKHHYLMKDKQVLLLKPTSGGFSYFEEGHYRPDLVASDLLAIFQGEGELNYFVKVSP